MATATVNSIPKYANFKVATSRTVRRSTSSFFDKCFPWSAPLCLGLSFADYDRAFQLIRRRSPTPEITDVQIGY